MVGGGQSLQLFDPVMGSKKNIKHHIPKKMSKKCIEFPQSFLVFWKKNPPVTDENLSRCTDGISLRRLEDHLGPEKNADFPWRFPKKAGTPTGKWKCLVKRAWKLWKKNILSRSYRLWASQNAPEFSNSCLVGKVQWRFRWQPYPLPLESPPVVPLSPKHHPETVPLLNGGHLTLWQCSKLEKHHFQSVNQPK